MIWKEEEDLERGKEYKVKSEESIRNIEVIEIETGSKKEEENDSKMTGRMGSVKQNKKRYWKIYQGK